MATAYHKVHYRFLETAPQSPHLENLVRAAFNTVGAAGGEQLWLRLRDRLYTLDGTGEGKSLLINRASDLTTAIFGEICLMQANDLQTIMKLEANVIKISNNTTVQAYDIEDRTAPTGSQFIRGMAYWMVIKNHIFFVKTHSMTGDLLAQYLEWLLTVPSSVLGKGAKLSLQAQIDPAAVSGDLGEIRSLSVKTKSGPTLKISPEVPVPITGEATQQKDTPYSRFVKGGTSGESTAFAIFKSLFGDAQASSLADSLGPNEHLVADTSFSVRGRRTAESRQRMKEIINAAADFEHEEVRVEGKDFKMSQGKYCQAGVNRSDHFAETNEGPVEAEKPQAT